MAINYDRSMNHRHTRIIRYKNNKFKLIKQVLRLNFNFEDYLHTFALINGFLNNFATQILQMDRCGVLIMPVY